MTFDDFQLDDAILEGIYSMGYKSPTSVQQQAIPLILEGRDIIASAQTGTGKTAAFVLPILQKIVSLPADGINTLILVPTRELAIQIDQQIDAMSYFVDVRSIAVYGGGTGITWAQQKKALSKGTDIIIATPGRLIAQMQMGGFDFSKLKHLILDEADRMLDMGFSDDISKIVAALPEERQTLCFSATMPPKIRELTKRIMRKPAEVTIAVSQPAEGILQLVYHAYDTQKLKLVEQILQAESYRSVIIFCGSKEKVKRLDSQLRRAKVKTKSFHSDLEQQERDALMQDFKNGKINVVVGTDILSRGIDVEDIDLVINYDVPHDPEDYIHRIGRTARAQRTGTAVTFVNEKDQKKFAAIERLTKRKIEVRNMPEEFGPAPEYHPQASSKKPAKKRKWKPSRSSKKGR